MKILIMACAPDPELQPNVLAELAEVVRRLNHSTHGREFEIAYDFQVELDRLTSQLLYHQPTLVHFSGHGGEHGELLFNNGRGGTQADSGDVLEAVVAAMRPQVRCVILNACYSEVQAEAISRHVDFVVGMRGEITGAAAIAFSATFHEAIAFGRTVREAFDLARAQVAGSVDADAPRLLVRQSANDAEILAVTESQTAAMKKITALRVSAVEAGCARLRGHRRLLVERQRELVRKSRLLYISILALGLVSFGGMMVASLMGLDVSWMVGFASLSLCSVVLCVVDRDIGIREQIAIFARVRQDIYRERVALETGSREDLERLTEAGLVHIEARIGALTNIPLELELRDDQLVLGPRQLRPRLLRART